MYLRWALAMAAWFGIAAYLIPADVLDILTLQTARAAMTDMLFRLR